MENLDTEKTQPYKCSTFTVRIQGTGNREQGIGKKNVLHPSSFAEPKLAYSLITC
jgi:hypothetical protein